MIKNKKAGTFTASIWFIGVAIYFIVFILAVYSAQNIANGTSNTNLTDTALENIDFNNVIGTSICENPRYYYEADTGKKLEYTKAEDDRLFCEQSVGIFSQSGCENIAGCSWENVTSGWWIFKKVDSASCLGDINSSAYGIESTEGFIGRPRVKPHNNTGLWAKYTPFSDPSVCSHPNVQHNKTLCDMFSCSWDKVEADTGFNSAGDIYSTIGDIFTFRYTFGFESKGIVFFLNFFLIVLPLLMLILSIYFMIPFIH